MKLPQTRIILMNFIRKYLSLTEDRSKYKKQLFKYRFTRWHKVKGELSEMKKIKRFRDESFEVMQLYETGEYRKAIEKIEHMHIDNAWDQLRFHAKKEKCLYHLKEEYALPKEKNSEILFVKQWETLIYTGKEYTYEHANEILSMMKKDANSFWGGVIVGLLPGAILGYLISFVFSLTLKDEAILENYVTDITLRGFEVSEVHGLCENNDMVAAVIYGKSLDGECPEQYYLAKIDYFTEGIVPRKKLEMEGISYLGETCVYTVEGDASTYVVALTDEKIQIIYERAVIKDVQVEKLSKPDSNAPYVYCFMKEGEYDKKLLDIETD